MGKRLDALLGRHIKTIKIKPIINLAVSRLAVLKKQRHSRLSMARADVLQLLNLPSHERAFLRVEQVIKEQNMLDAFVMIEGYCDLLIERISLVEHAKVCPDELKEAISSLLYAASRCGEFPELQEIRAVFTSRFGKEFVARAVELRNNCGVNPRMIQKLSTRQPGLESRWKVLKEIASENGIVLQIEEPSSVTTEEKLDEDRKQNQPKPDTAEPKGDSRIMPDEIERVEDFSDSMKGRRKYKDVADAAQAAFESAAYAAEAARAAVELSRSGSFDPDDQNSPSSNLRRGVENDTRGNEDLNVGLGFEKIHPMQNYQSEPENEEIYMEDNAEGSKQNKNAAEFKRSASSSSSGSADNTSKGNTLSPHVEGQTKPLGAGVVFDESDNETGNEQSGISSTRIRDSGFDMRGSSIKTEVFSSEKSNTVKYEDISEGSGAKLNYPSHKQFPLRSQAGLETELGPESRKSHPAEGSRMEGAPRLNFENRPISVRTRRRHGR